MNGQARKQHKLIAWHTNEIKQCTTAHLVNGVSCFIIVLATNLQQTRLSLNATVNFTPVSARPSRRCFVAWLRRSARTLLHRVGERSEQRAVECHEMQEEEYLLCSSAFLNSHRMACRQSYPNHLCACMHSRRELNEY